MSYDYDLIDVKAGSLTERGSIALAIMRERLGLIHGPSAADCEKDAQAKNGVWDKAGAATCENCWKNALALARKLAGSIKPFDLAAAKRFGPMARLSAAMTDLNYELIRGDDEPDELGRVYRLRFPV